MGGASATPWKAGKKKRHSDKEWEEIGHKVERKVMREIGKWADREASAEPPVDAGDGAAAEDDSRAARDAEWQEIGRKVEEKIKRKLRKWAEED
jgi:hypothetical protein